jgi:hypothetical protein
MSSFPIPSQFNTPVLAQYLSRINDDSAARELHHLARQAECGRHLLKAISFQLKLGNTKIIDNIPIPKKIRTEDGWEFSLSEAGLYVSDDGFSYSLTEILDLLSISPEEREQDMTPAFTLEWDD